MIAVAALVAFVVWLLVRGGGSGLVRPALGRADHARRRRRPRTSVTSPSRSAGRSTGSGRGRTTSTSSSAPPQDRIYVRYLPPDVSVGTTSAGYPLVGTYPVPGAYSVLKSLAKTSGEASFTAPRRRDRRLQQRRCPRTSTSPIRAPTCRSRSTTPRPRRPARSSRRGGSSRSVADGTARLLARLPARAGGALVRLRPAARARRRGEAAAAAACCRPA